MSSQKISVFVSHASELLTNYQPHGDGLTAFSFVRRLAERGYRLHVAAPTIDIQGELPPNIQLHPIKIITHGPLMQRLEYMLRSRLLLNRLRRAERIDLIHQLNPVNKGLSLAMLGSGLPVVLGVVMPSWPQDAEGPALRSSWVTRCREAGKAWLKQRLLAWQQAQASALLVATPFTRSLLPNAAQIEHKIVHLPIGIDPEQFQPADERRAPVTPNILFLANLWRRKGIFTLLEAFARVAARVPHCRLTIAGGGGEEAEVRRQIAASPYRQRIEMVGPVARERVVALLQSCTVYCLPSYGEPFGISALEAMACAKPLVVTAAGGLQELVPDGGGRKVAPRDAAALAEALIEIISSPALQAEMGQCNRQRVTQFYAWERVIDRLERVYTEVLAAQAQPQVTHSLQID